MRIWRNKIQKSIFNARRYNLKILTYPRPKKNLERIISFYLTCSQTFQYAYAQYNVIFNCNNKTFKIMVAHKSVRFCFWFTDHSGMKASMDKKK
jgi:hypothetical protein